MRKITKALTGASLLALATPAFAQEATAPEQAAEQASGSSADIVVTATRRAERLQDVPLAVSALGGEQLAATGFKDLTNIAYTFSGVQFGTTPNDAGFRVRGVGTLGGFTSASEAPVGLVVDNVVIGFGSPVNSLGDLERIEVLKGPQGTQFGKNASSGVINITTKKPELGEFSGNIYGSYGSFDERDIHGAVNVPIGSKAALNIYAFDRAYDGFIKNVVRDETWGGQHYYGTRAKLLVEPTEGLSVTLIGDYSRQKQKGPGQTWTLNKLSAAQTAPGGIAGVPFVNLAALGVTPGLHNEVSIEDGAGFYDVENYGASLQLDLELGDYTLTSVSAWREFNEAPFTYAIDGLPYEKFFAKSKGETKRFYSQELRLTSPQGQPLEYIAGLFFSRQKTGLGGGQSAILRPALPYSTFPTISITAGYNVTRTKSDSAALFFDGKYHITDTLSLLGGARLTRDKVTALNYSYVDPELEPFVPPTPANNFTPSGTLPYAVRAPQTGRAKKTDISGRLGLEYKPDRDLLFYATYARGYLGPTVTFSGLSGTRSTVAPQTVDDITAGAKMQFLDRTLTVNLNAFWDKYKDLQTSVFDGQEFLTENAGGAEVKGFEVELVARPSKTFSVNASFTYSDAKFTDYITACPTVFVVAGTAATVCNASATPGQLFDASGEVLPGSPKYSIVLGANWEYPITDRLTFDASSNLSFRSKTQNAVGDKNTIQPAYEVVNVNLGIGDADGAWRVGGFVRNLFDVDFNSAILGLPFSDGGYVNWRTREAERTFGVSFEARF
ncbi:TonB-dependent receptor [Sphingobium sp. EP60837]|jgi:iron complex outermembrane receptor protein|uniref:TonB-dependent receptor n=1 Tax=Sphingobium sp. EP60837 TaxID=1855519 RepID=UPI0007DD9194|nr:TonB-dependent receptor [Sphingobium sp. EP60837]ANI79452.1 Pesticin receptor [Sphingobium sp. EP60837]